MLSEIGKLGAKPCGIPMAPDVQLNKEGELFENPKRYKRLIEKLSYNISPRYYLFNKCFESVYVISHNQSLGSCRAYPMLFEKSS